MTQADGERFCLSRRAFLLSGGAAVTVMALGGLSEAFGQGAALQVASYPRRKIGRVSQLKVDQPVSFQYPWKDFNSTNMLVKLGTPAGGGRAGHREPAADRPRGEGRRDLGHGRHGAHLRLSLEPRRTGLRRST